MNNPATASMIWRVHLASNLSALRQDARARVTWLIALAIDFGAGSWSMHSLLDSLARWQAAGGVSLVQHLWLLCAGIWAGIAAFAALATLQQGFGSDQSLLLMSLPLAPSTRFRALYGLVLLEGVGNWLLLAAVVVGIPVGIALHWLALPWLLLLVGGMAVAVLIGLLGVLLVIACVLPLRSKEPRFSGYSIVQSGGAASRLYLRAFWVMEGRAVSHAAVSLPGIRLLSRLASIWRTPAGALLYKGLLYQSRSIFTWGRIAILVALLALFPVLSQVMIANGLSKIAQVVVYATGLSVLTVIEYAAYAISSEGARLSLYLLAPLSPVAYLRARLFVFLVPALAVGVAALPVLAVYAGLSPAQAGAAALFILLLLGGYVSFLVLASASDEDIGAVAEGAMQTLLQEELPTTPRRLKLLGLAIALLALLVALVCKLPSTLALLVLVVLNGLLIMMTWRYALGRLRRLSV